MANRKRANIGGLTEDAAKLGISRWFLYCVLRGWSTSKPTLERYRALHPDFKPAKRKYRRKKLSS